MWKVYIDRQQIDSVTEKRKKGRKGKRRSIQLFKNDENDARHFALNRTLETPTPTERLLFLYIYFLLSSSQGPRSIYGQANRSMLNQR